MYHYEIHENIPHRVDNATVIHLYTIWERVREVRGALPSPDDLSAERLAWCHDDLMLLEALPGGDYRYAHYGRNIAAASGFDMSGRRTSDFEGEVGDYFREQYAACRERQRPVYTVHRAEHARNVHTWERLIMPLADDADGAWLLVYNKPTAFRHEYLESVLESSLNGIIALAAVRDDAGGIVDFHILAVNEAAARIAGRAPAGLEDGSLLDDLSTLMGYETFDVCRAVAESGKVARREVHTGQGSGARAFEVSASPTRDGVTLTFADRGEILALQRALADARERLQDEIAAREALERRLRDLERRSGET